MAESDDDNVNLDQWCQISDRTTYQVHKDIRAGMPIVHRPTRPGDTYIINIPAARKWLASQPSDRSEGYDRQRARLVAEQADTIALKNAQLRASLLPAHEIELGWTMFQRHARGVMERVTEQAAKSSVELIIADGMDDPARTERNVRLHLQEVYDDALNELARWPESLAR